MLHSHPSGGASACGCDPRPRWAQSAVTVRRGRGVLPALAPAQLPPRHRVGDARRHDARAAGGAMAKACLLRCTQLRRDLLASPQGQPCWGRRRREHLRRPTAPWRPARRAWQLGRADSAPATRRAHSWDACVPCGGQRRAGGTELERAPIRAWVAVPGRSAALFGRLRWPWPRLCPWTSVCVAAWPQSSPCWHAWLFAPPLPLRSPARSSLCSAVLLEICSPSLLVRSPSRPPRSRAPSPRARPSR